MLGAFLRKAREAHGLDVREVAIALGIPRATIYMWESPRSRPDPVDIRRLLTHYGCDESEISEALVLRSMPAVDGRAA